VGNPDSRDTHNIPPVYTNIHVEGAAYETSKRLEEHLKTRGRKKDDGGKKEIKAPPETQKVCGKLG
jgi:hypothetical protein